jgi:hypothetical protein
MQHGNVKIKTYRITAVASVLYGYKTWSLALREEHRLRVFENRGALRKIFLHKTKEITGDWRILNFEYGIASSFPAVWGI